MSKITHVFRPFPPHGVLPIFHLFSVKIQLRGVLHLQQMLERFYELDILCCLICTLYSTRQIKKEALLSDHLCTSE